MCPLQLMPTGQDGRKLARRASRIGAPFVQLPSKLARVGFVEGKAGSQLPTFSSRSTILELPKPMPAAKGMQDDDRTIRKA